ncbi:phosphoribosylglycinamide formyltransferase [Candidatus Nitrosocosmicus franklandus]|uniref:phosphoribosylglycinamide formyltransferase 1 n=1 Tax=Candidatus Nitrosocosmicus franklandianus TaxID=1798806 RepID=A0A484IHF9_9ARCH|nr:phosphoribosylglycinamide formyltransferase [Candidatus Nitrosocosmicus franklandus]VFJ15452.1 Phosphoribosylglycinamide formyltransferase [Candidatus Nitrosocosmicus franklandus]
MINLAILISGRGSNMKSLLQAIRSGEVKGVKSVLVVSNNPDAIGLEIAKKEFGVKTSVVEPDIREGSFEKRLISELEKNDVYAHNGVICLAGFMRILGPDFVNRYRNKILNIHPSLLPAFKGLNAQKQALLAGVKVTGCTVHMVDNGVDSGPIILQKCVPVYDEDTEESLSERILIEEHQIYVKALSLFISNKLLLKDNRIVQIRE